MFLNATKKLQVESYERCKGRRHKTLILNSTCSSLFESEEQFYFYN